MIQLEGELFIAVQYPGIFEDSKTFVDAIAKIEEEKIMRRYYERKETENFNLEAFIRKYFVLPHHVTGPAPRIDSSSMEAYINSLWRTLEREPGKVRDGDTLLPLKYRYIVPGGRFREIYYWDTYFTSLGLMLIGRHDFVIDLVKNFLDLQNCYGIIPNGNRIYYTSRSQPPVLAFMIELLCEKFGFEYIHPFVGALETGHAFWMNGADQLSETNIECDRVVRMPDGSILNRYWDKLCVPRPESYCEDVNTAKNFSDEDKKRVYRHLRAAASLGWDFSSRWMRDPKDLSTTETTYIVPIDLNALLYGLEKILEKYHREFKNSARARIIMKKWLKSEKPL